MLDKEEASALQNTFNQSLMGLLNEQVSRTVMTQVISTGLFHNISQMFGKVMANVIAEEEETPDADDSETEAGLGDLSDIIIKEDDIDPGGEPAADDVEPDTVDTGDDQNA